MRRLKLFVKTGRPAFDWFAEGPTGCHLFRQVCILLRLTCPHSHSMFLPWLLIATT